MYHKKCAAPLAVAAALALWGAAPVSAQGGGTPSTASSAAAADPMVPTVNFAARPAQQVAASLSKSTGAIIVADRTVANRPITLNLLREPLSVALGRIVALLPAGTVVKKVMLPAPPPGTPAPDGDQVAALVMAQEALYRPTGRPAVAAAAPSLAPGEVDILGKRLSREKAAVVVTALELRPVYLLTNPQAAGDPTQKMSAAQAEMLRTWLGMSPEQQAQAADQQLDMLMNMDPALRRTLFAQQAVVMQKFGQRLQSLPPDQRRQLMLDMTGGRWDGTGTPPGAGGGGGGGTRQP